MPSAPCHTIRDVRRDVLPEAVRITMELDREVPFYQERLEYPSRVLLDLKGTRTLPRLVDAIFKYDTDVVRDIRLGRHPNSTTRIVVDLEGVSRYSVYTLYSPYRIVIDCERRTEKAERGALFPTPRLGPNEPPGEMPPLRLVAPARSDNSGGKFSVARQLGLGVSKIVIDAGHGGHDPGATAFGVSESELVLDVALRLEKLLQQQPGFETVLTRRTDEYVTLEERTEIANRESADLFLSIHANASATPRSARRRDLFPEFRAQSPGGGGGRPRERCVGPDDEQPARHREGHHAEQQAE